MLNAASTDPSLPQELRMELQALQKEYAASLEAQEILTQQKEQAEEKGKLALDQLAELEQELRQAERAQRETEAERDEQVQALESEIEDKEETIKRLTSQVSEVSKSTHDNQGLLDELDILREKLSVAGKFEAKLSKATKRLEGMEQLMEEKSLLEEQLNEVMKSKVELEAAAGRDADRKGEVNEWRTRATELEGTVRELKEESSAKDAEMERVKEEANTLQADNQSLKTANLELTNQLAMKDEEEDDTLGGYGLSSPTGLDFQSNMAEKERVMRLEQENIDLKAALEAAGAEAAGAEAAGAVQVELAALQARADAAEASVGSLTQEKEAAEKEVARLKEQLTKAVNVASMLKQKVKDKDEQLMAQAQGVSQDAGASAATEVRVGQLEEALREKEQELASATKLTETEALRREEKIAALQDEVSNLTEQLQQNKTDLVQGSEMAGQKLAVQDLQNKMHDKDKQIENLKSTLDESTKLKDSEIRLISTAFYEIGLEVQQRWRAPPPGRSWLAVQRKKLQSERAPFGK